MYGLAQTRNHCSAFAPAPSVHTRRMPLLTPFHVPVSTFCSQIENDTESPRASERNAHRSRTSSADAAFGGGAAAAACHVCDGARGSDEGRVITGSPLIGAQRADISPDHLLDSALSKLEIGDC